MVLETLKKTWPLFLGMSFLMLGNGLQGTLVSWRATYEGFTPSMIGWIMTAYYVGFLGGSILTPMLIKGVGHIRVFAALASMASAAILVQILLINPTSWLLMRLLTGFCFAGTYVIVEGWLNAGADNKSRGQILSIYMLISYGGLAAGQFLLKVADPAKYELFLLASILLSFALVPVLISKSQAPEEIDNENMGIRKLARIAPAGVASIFVSSIAQGSMFGMGAVYGVNAGMDIHKIALLMSMFIGIGALAHWPLGWLSDQIDRRLVVVGASCISALLCFYLLQIDKSHAWFFLLYGLLGGMILPIYSIGVAHTNDRLKPEQMTSASGTIVLLYGIGATLGPISIGYILKIYGNSAYFTYLAAVNIITAIIVLYYIFQREAVPDEEQSDYQIMPKSATVIAMDAVAQEAEETMGLDDEGSE
jgi:MFS family permease